MALLYAKRMSLSGWVNLVSACSCLIETILSLRKKGGREGGKRAYKCVGQIGLADTNVSAFTEFANAEV